ncbi:unnamed protein product [Trichogramma brassicae]|uniref:Acyl-coenzyme A oxidase n=1 Tax=Trichogramma brassicae TaxID=86971 RepID=A0A6H5IJH0_9HYME|nr:unnamed protein product [Trichogramma brassicae]
MPSGFAVRSSTRHVFEEDIRWLEDMPEGGDLDKYRASASFSWKRLRILMEDPDRIRFKMQVWKAMEADPEFHPPNGITKSADEQKRRAARQLARLHHQVFLPDNIINLNYSIKTGYMMALNEATCLVDPTLSVKIAIGIYLFSNTILSLGTERHLPIFHDVWNKKLLGCYALTEVGHGSNTKLMRTTATYEPESRSFVLHTPDFQAAKCWVGNLGKTATVAIVFAQLITKNECHGLHAFIVPVRDPKTYFTYPGVITGDLGEKLGLNGIDNGYIMFNNYKIPKENLLNRTADVTDDGDYESSFSDPQRILGAVLENLSAGRMGICQESTNRLGKSVVIAVRYAAVRKQFVMTPSNDVAQETPIIEYELHQWRLFPYMAAACVIKIFMSEFTHVYLDNVQKSMEGANIPNLSQLVPEIHSIVSAIKPLITWTCRDSIRECREACGGHGYHKTAALGDMGANHEPTVSYEGDNNVLVQQTSNWILRQWNEYRSGSTAVSPLASVSFLADAPAILRKTFDCRRQSRLTIDFVREAYEWLITRLVADTQRRYDQEIARGASTFEARSKSQVYRAASLSKAYGEFIILHYCMLRINKLVPKDNEAKGLSNILDKLVMMYSLTRLEKHMVTFYQGGYCTGPQMANLVKENILLLCAELKPEAVAIVDALAPPDFVLNSVLGMSDGKVYDRLEKAFRCYPGGSERPSWWSELLNVADKPLTVPVSKL